MRHNDFEAQAFGLRESGKSGVHFCQQLRHRDGPPYNRDGAAVQAGQIKQAIKQTPQTVQGCLQARGDMPHLATQQLGLARHGLQGGHEQAERLEWLAQVVAGHGQKL